MSKTKTVAKDQTKESKFWFRELPFSISTSFALLYLTLKANISRPRIVKMNINKNSTIVKVDISMSVLHIVLSKC